MDESLHNWSAKLQTAIYRQTKNTTTDSIEKYYRMFVLVSQGINLYFMLCTWVITYT